MAIIKLSTIYLLWIYKVHIIHAFHMIHEEQTLKQYTFYYESHHYDIPDWSLFPNQSISIIDNYNNTITYNSSLILSINNEFILYYHYDDTFNEIQKHRAITPSTRTNRRRLRHSRKWHHRMKKLRRRHKKRRERHRKQRSAVSRWVARWKARQLNRLDKLRGKRKHKKRHKHKSRYAQQGRFVGYFNSRRRGTTFKGAHNWCKRKYGELASIGNKHENEQTKRVCRVILGDNRRNGFYCWLGIYKYPFDKWTDKRVVEWKHYSPNQKQLNQVGVYTGKEQCVAMYKRTGYWYHQACHYRNGVICSKPRGVYVGDYIVIQKQYRYNKAKKICKQWYGTHLATIHNDEHNRNARSACQKVSDNGHCWIGLEEPFRTWGDGIGVKYTNWASGEPNNKHKEGCVEIYPSGRWNNIPCRVHRYPVCNGKTLFERMDSRLREYLIRKQYLEFREQWTKHQKQRWMVKQKRKKSKEYKWKQMLLKKMKMRMYGRYKDNLSTKFFNAQYGVNQQRKMGYEPLLTKKMLYGMYYQKYGRFPRIKDPKWLRDWLKRLSMQRRRQKWRAMGKPVKQIVPKYHMSSVHELHKHLYGDLDTTPFNRKSTRLSTSGLKGMNREIHMMMNSGKRTNGAPPYISLQIRRRLMVEDDRKCVLLGNIDGLQELCVGVDYIEIKRYVKRVIKDDLSDVVDVVEYGLHVISNASDVAVDYIDFENWKYKKGAFMDEYKMMDREQRMSVGYRYSLIDNVEEDVYYATRYAFVVDMEMGEQCWEGIEGVVELCLKVNGIDNTIRFDVAKEHISWGDLYSFDEDNHWDEVIVHIEDGTVSKCTHVYDMKICIEIENDIERNIWEINEMVILALYDDEQENEISL